MKKILIAAVSVDGKIARTPFHNVDWTSKKDKNFFRREVRKAKVVIFGANTFKTMRKAAAAPMPDTLNIILTHSPKKFTHLETPGKLEFTNTPPEKLLTSLQKRGFKSVVIGGGSEIYTLFLKKKLVDTIYLTIAPIIFGKGIDLFNSETPETKLRLIETTPLSKNEILLKYKLT